MKKQNIRFNPFSLFVYPIFAGFSWFFISGFYNFGWHPGVKKEYEEALELARKNGSLPIHLDEELRDKIKNKK